jgi:hypothetical protein
MGRTSVGKVIGLPLSQTTWGALKPEKLLASHLRRGTYYTFAPMSDMPPQILAIKDAQWQPLASVSDDGAHSRSNARHFFVVSRHDARRATVAELRTVPALIPLFFP